MTPKVTQEELQAATYATLRAHATSEQAKALVAKLSAMVEDHTIQIGFRKNKRKDAAGKLGYATGAFLADLLRSWNTDKTNGWVYRSLKKASFNGEAVAWRTFAQLIEGLKGLGFLDHVTGHKVAEDPYDDRTQYASRFRATPALLKFCVDLNVEPTEWSGHFLFQYDLPEHPIALRARKPKDYFGRSSLPSGTPMEFERTNEVAKIEDAVRELNEFFDKQILRGGEHNGYIRIFSNGDDPDFDWNKGGRLYSQHMKRSYQLMSGTQRRLMTINGEPVAEIDIRASYLTIFLSMHGIQLDDTEDPYELAGFGSEHRVAVKSWFTGTFGSKRPIRKWPTKMLTDEPTLSDYRPSTITQAVMRKYPAMATWGLPINGRILNWADLMFAESEVMSGAMRKLMLIDHAPSLCVHDSLIVPVSKAATAGEAIKMTFQAKHQVLPLIKINLPTGRDETGT
ncbi:hypothetical protein [Bradyrhizobium sp. AUGA SZCCT0042]|uniref:hypothetical protein n=1 Tax=Bradyrhizobium sp. AUGA SZCCT0042 TaxID=2807651 RepID=UPI001BAC4479|nr:hypothetical protein [Bradyrhizobium sp. AUGA SZCCT0042]MBR1300069.1 hypothetical protein [Bradyrhizobium sp. AUGA SZCCT0042]